MHLTVKCALPVGTYYAYNIDFSLQRMDRRSSKFTQPAAVTAQMRFKNIPMIDYRKNEHLYTQWTMMSETYSYSLL